MWETSNAQACSCTILTGQTMMQLAYKHFCSIFYLFLSFSSWVFYSLHPFCHPNFKLGNRKVLRIVFVCFCLLLLLLLLFVLFKSACKQQTLGQPSLKVEGLKAVAFMYLLLLHSLLCILLLWRYGGLCYYGGMEVQWISPTDFEFFIILTIII